MIVEVLPGVGGKELNAGVERGRAGHKEGQQGGVERGNVAKMHQVGIGASDAANEIGCGDETDDDEEDK